MKRLPINRIAIGLAILAALAPAAKAAPETVLYSFSNSGTGNPEGDLYFRNGSLYGTGAGDHQTADGQVFKLINKGGSWKAKTLVTFNGANGSTPVAGLIRGSNGVLYGTTWAGGAYKGGSVFALTRSGGKWVEQTLWNFGGAGDGLQPECDLVMDKSGNLYGTTYIGGAYNAGTVFELSNVNGVWTETVLLTFSGKASGWDAYGGLLMAGPETFFGTTQYGGDPGGDGTVFKLFKSGGVWKEKVLYAFTGGADGGEPLSTLVRDKNGALYGTTEFGGAPDTGVAFMLSPSGGRWTETVLHVFDWENEAGYSPIAGLRWGPSGSLYGTTARGAGTVFELTQSGGVWAETILHAFGGQGDGSYPVDRITLDKTGALYGTTEGGGKYNDGTVWKIMP
ncbi:MAG: choice-of-anchor tandem repeat GloVer-containing protein [Rhizomicrobium sp.]